MPNYIADHISYATRASALASPVVMPWKSETRASNLPRLRGGLCSMRVQIRWQTDGWSRSGDRAASKEDSCKDQKDVLSLLQKRRVHQILQWITSEGYTQNGIGVIGNR